DLPGPYEYRRSPTSKWFGHRNLAHRPAKPALGNGKVQRAAKRQLLLGNGTCSTSEVARRCYGRKTLLGGHRIGPDDYRHVRRAGRRHYDAHPSIPHASSGGHSTGG